jgi:hypothetical protein
VQPDHPLGVLQARGDAGDRQRAGVGRQDRVRRQPPLELGEELPLDGEVFDDGLDD